MSGVEAMAHPFISSLGSGRVGGGLGSETMLTVAPLSCLSSPRAAEDIIKRSRINGVIVLILTRRSILWQQSQSLFGLKPVNESGAWPSSSRHML